MKTTTAERLKELMLIRGLKQSDIVSMCEPYCKKYKVKIGRSDISQYVSGKVIPKQNKLSILGMALKVSEVWLMGYNVPLDKETVKQERGETSIKVYLNRVNLLEKLNKISEEKYNLICQILKPLLDE